jgi:hypothetical protein
MSTPALATGSQSIAGETLAEVLSPEEAKLLTCLCREGKLYEIEKWISSGKSLRVPPAFKRTPLQTAIDQEFHSLIELLARNETSREVKNGALAAAVSMRRLEYIHLLLDHGAEIRAVPVKSKGRSLNMGATQREGVRGGSPPVFHPKFHPKTSADF